MPAINLGSVLRYMRVLSEAQTVRDLSDGELLERFRTAREETALALLVQRHGPMVLGVCRRLLAHMHDAEDAFQATFLLLVRKAGAIRKQDSIASWLHGVARRVAMKARVRAARMSALERQYTAMQRSQARDDVGWQEVRDILDEELDALPEKYRRPLILCELEGKTHQEAARELHCPRTSVSTRLSRARLLLKQRLVRRGITISTATLVSLMTDNASAAVPALLTIATVRVAAAKTASGISAGVALLAEEGIKSMGIAKLSLVLSLVLATCLAAAGTVMVATPSANPGRSVGEQVGADAEARHQPKSTEQPKVDRFGDPLPPGAIVRMGTTRFRHAEGVTCAVFAPDGKTLITASHDCTLRAWDTATGKELHRFVGHTGAPRLMALSPNGTLLASWASITSETGQLQVWDTATAKELRQLGTPKELITSLVWSPDNKTLVAGQGDGIVRLWDAVGGKELRSFAGHNGPVGSVAFSPDGEKLASAAGHKDGTVCLVNLTGGKELLVLRAPPGEGRAKEVHFVAFAPDGKTLISGGDCYGDNISTKIRSVNTITVWTAATGERLRQFRVGDDQEKPNEGAASAALSPDGKTLALGYWDHTIRLWDIESGKPLRKLTGYSDRFYPAYHLAFAPDGKKLAASGSHHTVCLLDTATGKPLFDDGPAQKSNIRSVALSPDGKVLATASHDYTVCLWDTATGRPLHQLRGHGSWVYTVAFAPSGRIVASGSSDGTVRLWDVANGKEVRRLGDNEVNEIGLAMQHVAALAFAPDGKVLASCHDPGGKGERNGKEGIHLWDVQTGKELRRLAKSPLLLHGGTMAFSPDGKTLLTAVHSLRRWKVSTGEEIGAIDIPGEASSEIALSADGTMVAKSTYDGLTLVCDALTGRQLSAIRRPEGTIYRIAFSPDGRFLALCSASYMPTTANDLAIELWELASGKLVRTHALPRHTGVSSVAFAASGSRLATGMADTTAIIWDMGPQHSPLAGEEGHRLEDHWKALAADDAAKAYQAMGQLIESAGTAAFLEKKLKPATELDTKPILRLIADLDNDEFSVRQKASRELEKLGPEAEHVFRRTLEGEVSPEARRRLTKLLEQPLLPITSTEVLQNLRCVAVLERIGSPEARGVLERLAKGAPPAPLTREAKAALERLARRTAP